MIKLRKTIHEIISNEVPENCKVLDLGCGEGDLLNFLINNKKVLGHGIDINSTAIIKCIEKGISVIQWDLDLLPLDFRDKSYDCTILNQTITQIRKPKEMIDEMLRIGKKGILGFLNFGNIGIRLQFLFEGKMPIAKEIPYKWYDTPNIRLLTIKDFYSFCKENDITIEKVVFLKRKIFGETYKKIKLLPNLRADLSVFIIKKT
ncbi:MAG TPA: methionine biosynthesis protein MetW [Spirochaetota bacterium]|nr:methionine biosynthesis protein MetW [Spirochaetota bacterium]